MEKNSDQGCWPNEIMEPKEGMNLRFFEIFQTLSQNIWKSQFINMGSSILSERIQIILHF